MAELNEKQLAFVREYCIDFNATQAAVRAGYSVATAKQQGSRLLSHDDVQAALRDALSARAERTNASADRVVQELEKLAFSDIRKAVTWRSINPASVADDGRREGEEWDEDGEDGVSKEPGALHITDVRFVDSRELDAATAAAIAGIKVDGKGALSIKFHSKQAALETLAKHHGLLKEKVELNASDELLSLLDQRRARAKGKRGDAGNAEAQAEPGERARRQPRVARPKGRSKDRV